METGRGGDGDQGEGFGGVELRRERVKTGLILSGFRNCATFKWAALKCCVGFVTGLSRSWQTDCFCLVHASEDSFPTVTGANAPGIEAL